MVKFVSNFVIPFFEKHPIVLIVITIAFFVLHFVMVIKCEYKCSNMEHSNNYLIKENSDIKDELRKTQLLDKEVSLALETELKDSQEQIRRLRVELKDSREQIKRLRVELKDLQEQRLRVENYILPEQSQTYPWLSNFIADYYELYDDETVEYLKSKRNPALKSAEIVSQYKKELRQLRFENQEMKHQIAIYENTVPWLEEFKEIKVGDLPQIVDALNIADEKNDNEYDRIKNWLSPEEYKSLPNVEKYQLALDRYIKRDKTNWEIGREYERYIGYLYEKKGYSVSFYGALMGVDDLGRDLIAQRDNSVLIIQCKNWSEKKTIHEKHIFQLFGTVTEYNIVHRNDPQAKGLFISTCQLSDRAAQFADVLGIATAIKPFDPQFPRIKCNISRGTGEKIYHLPFDQQYDKVKIEPKKGECYTLTVKEAEDNGFRRAMRHFGTDSEI